MIDFMKLRSVNGVCLVVFIGLIIPSAFTQYEYYRQYPINSWSNGYNGVGNDRFETDVVYFDSKPLITEGDYCTNTRLGVEGICRAASQCPEIYEDFRKGIKPIVCSYTVSDIVVCCPKKEPLTLDKLNGPRISEQKCKDYSKLAVSAGLITELSVIPSVHQIDISTCDYSTGLVVGGELAKHGEFPHMAAIGWSEADGTVNWNCGGTLISEFYILTAAHCSSIFGTRPDIIRLGSQNLIGSDERSPPRDIRIQKIITHPNYKHSTHYNDIALIELVQSVQFSRYIRPACLWQTNNVNTTVAIATGWGQIEFGGKKSDDLLKVALDIVDNISCDTLYERSKRLKDGIIDSQICAGYLQGGKDTCQGDSGGPIQITTTKRSCVFHIIGITSFGKACAAVNTVGVYTRVSSYLDWIESIVWPQNI